MKYEHLEKVIISIVIIFIGVLLAISIIFAYQGATKTTNKNEINNSGNITQQVRFEYPYNSQIDKININACSKEALESLPDIGDKLAEKIINGRPYTDVYELDKIEGIGEDTIDILKDKVRCN